LLQRAPEFCPRRFSLEAIQVGGSLRGRSRFNRCLELEAARLCRVLGGFGFHRSGFGFELPRLGRAHLETSDEGRSRGDNHHHEQQYRQLSKARARVRFLFGSSALLLGLRLRFRALPALHVARRHDLLDDEQYDVLAEAWRLAMRVRNAVVLARGKASDALPVDSRSLAAVARAMGYPAGHTQDLVEDYRRATRRARAVYEVAFFA